MELRICEKCNTKYGWHSSEPSKVCECGGKLRSLDFNNLQDPYGSPIKWKDDFKRA